MNVTVKRLTEWSIVLDSARTTVGKEDLSKEPSDQFKKDILVKEHSPIRNLIYEIIWNDIPYWVAMHFRTHHIGFHSGEDDLFFVQTQRTDRTQTERDNLPQNTKVKLRAVLNAHSIINVSRVRLCRLAAKETREAWSEMLDELEKIEPILYGLCQENCIYRGACPEGKQSCGLWKTDFFTIARNAYESYFSY